MSEPILRPAVIDDIPEILEMIHLLAIFEREPDAVKATEEGLRRLLFDEHPSVFATLVQAQPGQDRRLDGMALWFRNFSTWEGTLGIYLEDLYIREEARSQGLGTRLLSSLAHTCVERGYSRLEWCVLKWNKPAIAVYEKVGAVAQDEWDTYRVSGNALLALGDSK